MNNQLTVNSTSATPAVSSKVAAPTPLPADHAAAMTAALRNVRRVGHVGLGHWVIDADDLPPPAVMDSLRRHHGHLEVALAPCKPEALARASVKLLAEWDRKVSEAEARTRLEAWCRVLAEAPPWTVSLAFREASQGGLSNDPNFPPAPAAVAKRVAELTAPYRQARDAIKWLLDAHVVTSRPLADRQVMAGRFEELLKEIRSKPAELPA